MIVFTHESGRKTEARATCQLVEVQDNRKNRLPPSS